MGSQSPSRIIHVGGVFYTSELLSTVAANDARSKKPLATAETLAQDGPTPTQRQFLDSILDGNGDGNGGGSGKEPTLGLYDPAKRTQRRRPERRNPTRLFVDQASFAIAETIDDLAEANRNTPFEVWTWQGSREMLLVDIPCLPDPFGNTPVDAEDSGSWGMVMPHISRAWWNDRPTECRQISDPIDALRALVAVQLCHSEVEAPYLRQTKALTTDLLQPLVGKNRLQLRHANVVRHV